MSYYPGLALGMWQHRCAVVINVLRRLHAVLTVINATLDVTGSRVSAVTYYFVVLNKLLIKVFKKKDLLDENMAVVRYITDAQCMEQ